MTHLSTVSVSLFAFGAILTSVSPSAGVIAAGVGLLVELILFMWAGASSREDSVV